MASETREVAAPFEKLEGTRLIRLIRLDPA
jgi:hypothetical protein